MICRFLLLTWAATSEIRWLSLELVASLLRLILPNFVVTWLEPILSGMRPDNFNLNQQKSKTAVDLALSIYRQKYLPAALATAAVGSFVLTEHDHILKWHQIKPIKEAITVESINKTKPGTIHTDPPKFIKITKKELKVLIDKNKKAKPEEIAKDIEKYTISKPKKLIKNLNKIKTDTETNLEEEVCVQNCAQLLLPLEGISVDPAHPLSSWVNRN